MTRSYLKNYRKEKKIKTQDELIRLVKEKTGVTLSKKVIKQIEHGCVEKTSFGFIMAICRTINCTVDQLLDIYIDVEEDERGA